ncbi:L-seryl-tRNA(Sec) selenium transferase [Alkalicoccus halolimnae]|uniref:L-seryl-tRNA(Sec) selenium transferase n=1 Tax=Alkalicoccus halolimnae TaxID=1667239 RepID=A0A5C7FPJ3_9BACI|nr:L-seryl-tRNA(Sec) selenium transferase [Alkalicoccus halolimnae]TXF87286.1 L-seryl-tRNA(Sec) selenium transferase [Alkalicoccus halolimnae]
MKNKKETSPLRYLPPVHEILQHENIQSISREKSFPYRYVKKIIQQELLKVRKALEQERITITSREEAVDQLIQQILPVLENSIYNLRPLVNATGTVLHTNLGRARLSRSAAEHAVNIATSYSNLEYDLEEGKRGSRLASVEGLLAEASGTEAAMVVNNNAAAVYFVLAAFAKHKEVIVSRGELVEIGGSFRVSSIMEESGASLVEVGTTNKTRLSDYTQAISEHTSMIMKVHTSNFSVVGFTESVSSKELKGALKKENQRDIILFDDLGSGSLFPYEKEGIGEEPLIRDALNNGADLISFSGDKLLGGPQAGVIAGRRDLISKLKKHQLARVLRLDKMTLAALEATLFDYVYGDDVKESNPTVRDIMKNEQYMMKVTENRIAQLALEEVSAEMEPSFSKVGGGTMPLVNLPGPVMKIRKRGWNAEAVEVFFRTQPSPVIGRIKQNDYYLDMRTVNEEEWDYLKTVINQLDKEEIQ